MAEQTHGKASVTIEFDARSRTAFNGAVEELHQMLDASYALGDGVTVTRHDTQIGEVTRMVEPEFTDQDDASADYEDAPPRRKGKPGPKRGPKGGGIAAAKAKTAKGSRAGQMTKTDDPEAPYGRKADGTPRGKPGRKPSSESDSGDGASVTSLPRKGASRLPSRRK